MLIGPEEGGLNTLEYSAVVRLRADRATSCPLPGVLSLWPLLELEARSR
jgi:hypothetical protein